MMVYLQTVSKDVPKFMHSTNEFLQFLYDLNLLCYIERPKEGKAHFHWCFKERNYSNISPKVKTEVEYQVFYGLNKSLLGWTLRNLSHVACVSELVRHRNQLIHWVQDASFDL